MQDKIYEFSEKPLYTRQAVELLEEQQQSTGGGTVAAEFRFLSQEAKMLEEYLDSLEPYNEILQQGYEDIYTVPRPETVLGRLEDDMDRLARGRHQLLNEEVSADETRRELLEGIFQNEEYDTPVMTDTWIIMKESEKLRQSEW